MCGRKHCFKLLKNEIKGKIFRVIENMYKGCIAGVKSNGPVSAMFECRKGVRQGDVLSPNLFNILLMIYPNASDTA